MVPWLPLESRKVIYFRSLQNKRKTNILKLFCCLLLTLSKFNSVYQIYEFHDFMNIRNNAHDLLLFASFLDILGKFWY